MFNAASGSCPASQSVCAWLRPRCVTMAGWESIQAVQRHCWRALQLIFEHFLILQGHKVVQMFLRRRTQLFFDFSVNQSDNLEVRDHWNQEDPADAPLWPDLWYQACWFGRKEGREHSVESGTEHVGVCVACQQRSNSQWPTICCLHYQFIKKEEKPILIKGNIHSWFNL